MLSTVGNNIFRKGLRQVLSMRKIAQCVSLVLSSKRPRNIRLNVRVSPLNEQSFQTDHFGEVIRTKGKRLDEANSLIKRIIDIPNQMTENISILYSSFYRNNFIIHPQREMFDPILFNI